MNALSVSRQHGLGNVIQLLRRLRLEAVDGRDIELITRPEWATALRVLAPEVRFGSAPHAETINLDAATEVLLPSQHRQSEFAELLGLAPREPGSLSVPEEWRVPWRHLAGYVAFSPEAEHASRRCPAEVASAIAAALRAEAPTVLLGSSDRPPLAVDLDLRQQTTLQELIGVIASVRAVVCMDSGVLHIALALSVPTVALFGGINPDYRISEAEHCIALAGDVACRPCNKQETCDGRYDCLWRLSADAVRSALRDLPTMNRREIRVV